MWAILVHGVDVATASESSLLLSLVDPANVAGDGWVQATLDARHVACLTDVTEIGPAAALGLPRYVVSRDAGVTFVTLVDGGWVTGARLEQALTATQLAGHLRALTPSPWLTVRARLSAAEPGVEALSFEPCACGDAVVDPGESCDDGGAIAGDGCGPTCRVEVGWACAGAPSRCAAVCGNGHLNLGEECDDDDAVSGDGCSDVCRIEPGWSCRGGTGPCDETCGDAVLDPGEECDGGNEADGDGCSAECRVEPGATCRGSPSRCEWTCGDGRLDPGEQCDDRNRVDGDGCGSCRLEPGHTCTGAPSVCTAACGDGIIDAGEECDDGDVVGGDGCGPTCRVERGSGCVAQPSLCAATCGNGKADFGEECDDGDGRSGDGCSGSCRLEHGLTCAGEPSVCRPTCGDGLVASGEGCDDGNLVAADGCEAACQPEPGWSCAGEPSVCSPTCGDGALDPGEQCDDGNPADGDGCSGRCAEEAGFRCVGQPSYCDAVCGDGITGGGEGCDDGNSRPGDGCDATCAPEPGWSCAGTEPTVCATVCGDGIPTGDEACDDGNREDRDGCDASCRFEAGWACDGAAPSVCAAVCGDALRVGDERCDDGNRGAGDGCGPTCDEEPGFTCTGDAPSVCASLCGDGVRAGLERCDDGNTEPGDGCGADCEREAGWLCEGTAPTVCATLCGDGLRVGNEQCDDGGEVGDDGCSARCELEAPGDGATKPAATCELDGDLQGGRGCAATGATGATAVIAVLLALVVARRRRRNRGGRWFLGLALLLIGSRAGAQGLDLQRFSPAVRADDLAVLSGVERAAAPTVGLATSYTRKPLVVAGPGGEVPVVADRLELVLGAVAPLWSDVDVSVTLPLVLYQSRGAAWQGDSFVAGSSRELGVGTPRLAFSVPLDTLFWERCRFSAVPAIGAAFGADTLGGRAIVLAPAAAMGCEVGPVVAVARLGVELRTRSAPGVDGAGASATYGAGVGAHLAVSRPRDLFVAVEAIGAALAQRPFARRSESPVELLVSGSWVWREGVSLVGGVGTGVVPGYGAPAWRSFFGLRWELHQLPWVDTTGAGRLEPTVIRDPGLDVEPTRLSGAPPAGDLVVTTVLDDEAEPLPPEPVAAPLVLASGPAPEAATAPAGATPLAGAAAPAGATALAGATAPAGATALAGATAPAAPTAPPAAPRVPDGPAPPRPPARVRAQRVVYFGTGDVALKPRARQVLDELATTLARSSGSALQIAGHTDTQGTYRRNQVLSEQRARAVRDYLLGRGVEAQRLVVLASSEAPAKVWLTPRELAYERRVDLRLVAP